MYELRRTQILDAPIDEVFSFFSEARNLALLTPRWLGFRILTPGPVAMQPGTTIDYRIWMGPLPLMWRTRITHWMDGEGFVDEQERGPYQTWIHEHRFEAIENRTLMTDTVRYALPLGVVGRLTHYLCVRFLLKLIFDYRHAQAASRFPPQNGL